ncbi:MAG: hypothetical protein E7643_03950 [Ruminococcaceae bacterium]|nr:hypothetical protein [Oscillospiraceae bacterium]
MIRGAKKQMIVLQTGNSPYFDTAYFILRNKQGKEAAAGDILEEANKILSENVPSRPVRQERLRRWLLFLFGTLCGAAAATAVSLLIFLL